MDKLNVTVLTFEEGCAYMGYAKSTVYKFTMCGIIPFSKPRKKIFFEKEKLDQWLLSNPSKSHKEKQILAATYLTAKGGSLK